MRQNDVFRVFAIDQINGHRLSRPQPFPAVFKNSAHFYRAALSIERVVDGCDFPLPQHFIRQTVRNLDKSGCVVFKLRKQCLRNGKNDGHKICLNDRRNDFIGKNDIAGIGVFKTDAPRNRRGYSGIAVVDAGYFGLRFSAFDGGAQLSEQLSLSLRRRRFWLSSRLF